jgi:hypothetical protein
VERTAHTSPRPGHPSMAGATRSAHHGPDASPRTASQVCGSAEYSDTTGSPFRPSRPFWFNVLTSPVPLSSPCRTLAILDKWLQLPAGLMLDGTDRISASTPFGLRSYPSLTVEARRLACRWHQLLVSISATRGADQQPLFTVGATTSSGPSTGSVPSLERPS